MGRWSAQHRKTAIWGWLGFVIVAFIIGGAVGTKTLDNAHLGVGESGRADRTVDAAYPKSADEMVLVQSAREKANSLRFRAAVGDAQFRLSQLPYVYAVESPYTPANRSQISADGHSALIRFKIAGSDPIEGLLHCDGKTVSFSGWLELISVVEAAKASRLRRAPGERRPDLAPDE